MDVRYKRGQEGLKSLNEENVKKSLADAKYRSTDDVVVDLYTKFINSKAPGQGEEFAKELRNQIITAN